MEDIQSRADVELLINEFYKKATKDEVIGYIFTKVVKLDWDIHIPVMYDFWETILLGNRKYKGNPMLPHIALNKKEKLEDLHFERWISLWESTTNEHFAGDRAKEAIRRAKMMGELMKYKIKQSENNTFIQ